MHSNSPAAQEQRQPLPGSQPIYISAFETYETIDLSRGSINVTRDRTVVANDEIQRGRTAVILVFGQSNGSNSGEAPYRPQQRVLNFNLFDGLCYQAIDPLLGATEDRGNFAGRLGDKLIQRGVFDTVVLIPFSVGGSRIEEWTTGGARHRRLQVAIKRAADIGLFPTHLLWHQGETNAGQPDYQIYVDSFMDIHAAARRYGVTAPIYVARASVCASPPCKIIRAARRNVVDAARGILSGPDTDAISSEHRFDGCHMSESGLIRHADLWFEILATDQPARHP